MDQALFKAFFSLNCTYQLQQVVTFRILNYGKVYHKMYSFRNRGRILGRNWDKSLKTFHPCYSQPPLLIDFTPAPLLSKSGLKLVCIVNNAYGNSRDYSQKPPQNYTFMNSASGYCVTYRNTVPAV